MAECDHGDVMLGWLHRTCMECGQRLGPGAIEEPALVASLGEWLAKFTGPITASQKPLTLKDLKRAIEYLNRATEDDRA